ncbi:TBCC domain-containing protein [Cephalotus follicularis]|uniref:TBCC domain-containing protein 1 n=1 Tax=Cephalotus follicularis TaxID=3775 RepID=A0A1Q3B7B9_CEPFO|nr:TBCC domain-containing protein [Cephalotus follicularis]
MNTIIIGLLSPTPTHSLPYLSLSLSFSLNKTHKYSYLQLHISSLSLLKREVSMSESIEPSTSSSRDPAPDPNSVIHPRREPFEHGLLPIPKLIFADPTQTLASLRRKILSSSPESAVRVDSATISESLQISIDHARLVLDTLASVLHSESDPLARAKPDEIDSVGADFRDLMLFLYIQSYKRLLPRTHKDSASVADVWPSTSAFDGYLSALSPLQLVRSNSRRFMPSQADEEVHQLSYLQKHLANILSLLADSVDDGGEESLVLTTEGFEHLGFLIQFGDKGSEGIPLSQAPPFFANSDPDMPAVPVPAAQVHDWILENITVALEHLTERVTTKENGPPSASDQDVAMTDACTTSVKASISTRGPSFIEGISKSSYVKHASDLKASSVKVLHCNDSVIYILAPLRYATVYGCSDATIVLGAVGKAVRVEHCERVHVITAAKRVCIANCRECVFFLGVNQRPLIVGDNHKLQVAPYNTFYSQLEEHMVEVGIEATINRWDEPLALGVVDPHDSLSHPAGVSDVQAESATRLDADQFTNFLIPNWFGSETPESTKDNPFPLPEAYMTSQQRNQKNLGEIKQILREAPLEENRKRELSSALHVYFRDWLYASGNIRQLYCLQGE